MTAVSSRACNEVLANHDAGVDLATKGDPHLFPPPLAGEERGGGLAASFNWSQDDRDAKGALRFGGRIHHEAHQEHEGKKTNFRTLMSFVASW